MTWHRAYFQQAESDYAMFRDLNKNKKPLCHRLHYLQMATEKLAKSFLIEFGSLPLMRTHFVLVKFMKLSKGDLRIRSGLGYGQNYHAYSSYIDSLLDIANRVEKSVPVGASYNTPNAEYPWEDASGVVQCPCLYAFSEFGENELRKLMGLVSNLFRAGSSIIMARQ